MTDEFNSKFCDERHEKIGEEFMALKDRIKTVEGRLWAIIVLLVFNFAGIIFSIITRPGFGT